jgi:hypothetical protein
MVQGRSVSPLTSSRSIQRVVQTWQRRSRETSRSLGVLTARLNVFGAVRVPALHEALLWAGVLDRAPASWDDAPVVEKMPWGAGRFPAPPVTPPEGITGPWPQPAAVDPRFYAPVLNVPAEDRRDHVRYIVSRYLGQLVSEVPGAALRALQRGRLVGVDDAEFTHILTETSFGQFVCPELDDATRADFAAVLAPEGAYGRMDFSVCPAEHLLPGMHAEPVVVLVRRLEDRWTVPALRVGRRVVTPADGDTWALAKCFTLLAAQTRLVGASHPRIHFPADVINAVTRSVLPATHPIYQLIAPHTRFTLGLHEAVIHHRRSSIHNSQHELYNGFPYRTEGMHELVATGNTGVEGNSAWGAYRFGDEFVGDHVAYGRYRRAWRDAWEGFAAEALARVDARDPVVRAWADHIAEWLPGFPDGNAIAEGDALSRAVATYLACVTTFHTADHHSFANIALEKMPWRIRKPFPQEGSAPAYDLDTLVTPEDSFRARLAHSMFFRPAVITSLRDITYNFSHPDERAAALRWQATMSALDAQWQGSGFPRADEIASGVHY